MSCVFLFTFFTATHFHLALVVASISHFVTAATKFSCCSFNKTMSPLFFYLSLKISVALFLVELRWPAAYLLFFRFFSCYIFQICGHDTWSKLNTLENTDTETFPLSVFVFTDCLVIFASQDAGNYATSRQNNLDLHLGCHACWLSYFTLVCLTDGLAVGRCTVTWLSFFFSDGQFTTFLYPWCSAVGASSAIKKVKSK